jgi:hypothetical protein
MRTWQVIVLVFSTLGPSSAAAADSFKVVHSVSTSTRPLDWLTPKRERLGDAVAWTCQSRDRTQVCRCPGKCGVHDNYCSCDD